MLGRVVGCARSVDIDAANGQQPDQDGDDGDDDEEFDQRECSARVRTPRRSSARRGSPHSDFPVANELAVQRRRINAEHFRRAGLVATFVLQHPMDVRALDCFE